MEEEQVELRLLADPEYSQEFDAEVDEIIDRYIAGEFDGEELERVRSYFFKSEARQQQLRFARALRERKLRPADYGKKGNVIPLSRPSPPPPPPKRSITPYLSIAAGVIVAIGIGFILYLALRTGSELERGLVALNEAYEERPVEVRLSDLKYAPMPNQRGGAPRADYVKRELAGSRLRTAATESPSAASLGALGQWYLTERKYDEAVDQFNKALALDPNDAKSHLNLGAALLEKGKLDVGKTEGGRSENLLRSLGHINKGLQLDSSLLEGYFNRALLYQYMMLPREAEAAWQEYLQKDPNSQWADEAKRNLKRLEESNDRNETTVDDTLKEFRQARLAGDDPTARKLRNIPNITPVMVPISDSAALGETEAFRI